MKIKRCQRLTQAVLLGGVAALTVACSSIATGSSEVALQYEGGAFESNAYYDCYGNNGREYIDWGDTAYFYPTGQRDFTFKGDGSSGADAAVISSTTKDGQEINVAGTIKFTMNLSCDEYVDPTGKKWPGGTAQYFHELIGNKNPDSPAYNEEGSQAYGDGWSQMLASYVGVAANDALDRATTDYSLDELTLRGDIKPKWQDAVKKNLPDVLNDLTGGVKVFDVKAVLLEKPGVRPEIADARAKKIAAQEQVAASDIIAQRAKSWPGGLEAYQKFLSEQAINKAIESGKVQVIPVPQGSPVIVSPR